MGVLNLPRVTGWGTDAIAQAVADTSRFALQKQYQQRRFMIDAIRDQAASGVLTPQSRQYLKQTAPVLLPIVEQADAAAKASKALETFRRTLEIENLAMSSINKLIEKGRKYAEIPNGKDAANRQFAVANQYGRKVFGDSWTDVSITSDPVITKREKEIEYTNKINQRMTQVEQMLNKGLPVQRLLSEMKNSLILGEKTFGRDSMKAEFTRLQSIENAIRQNKELQRKAKPASKAPIAPSSQSRIYISTMNQILKEYGSIGQSTKVRPDGSIELSSSGDKAYKEMVKLANSGDKNAIRNLSIYKNIKNKLIGLSGVRVLTVEKAREYLRKARGNRKAAEAMARKDGWVF